MGRPRLVYRGSREGATTRGSFSRDSIGAATGHPSAHLGVWATSSKQDASSYGQVSEFYIDMRNPHRTRDLPDDLDTPEKYIKYRDKLIAEGKDGVIIDHRDVGGAIHYVMFKPEQVVRASGKKAAPATAPSVGEIPKMDVGEIDPVADIKSLLEIDDPELLKGLEAELKKIDAVIAKDPNYEVDLDMPDGSVKRVKISEIDAEMDAIESKLDAFVECMLS